MTSSAERQYVRLIDLIMTQGNTSYPTKGTTKSIFGHTIILQPEEVPLLQGREIFYKGLVGELKAFIANERTNEGFRKHGCNFWGEWSNDDGTVDVDYARLLHNFNNVNQLDRLIKGLKEKPSSRKHVISLWDPSSKSKQVPCVLSYQWQISGGKLHMIWTQRSADVMVGLASDMFSAWLFNQLMAKTIGMEVGTVTMNIGDAHIYESHIEGVEKYLDGYWSAPLMQFSYLLTGDIHEFAFSLNGYKPETRIKFELKV